MVQYQYAKGHDGTSVNVQTLTNDQRYKLSPYTCYGCNSELIPNLCIKKNNYFSHKSTNNCSKETYLHCLAKEMFFKKYSDCLKNSKPFIFKLNFSTSCNHYEEKFGECCHKNRIDDIDLTKYFDQVELEKKYFDFIPDVLLSSKNQDQVTFVEFAVTHKCESKKIEFGKRIIEIHISDEHDLQPIINGEIFESSNNVSTYNFNKKIINYDCYGDCPREISTFIIFKNGKIILLEHPLNEANNGYWKGGISYSETIGFASGNHEVQRKIYIKKIREAYFNKIDIKSCFLCRYHGLDGVNFPIFCKYLKKGTASNEAIVCKAYRPFKNKDECIQIDKDNKEFMKNNRVKLLPKLMWSY